MRRWEELSGPDSLVNLTAESVAVLPIGAIEHHGPHLPLSTDWTIATAYSEQLVSRVADTTDVCLLPSLAVSKSDEHAWASGTLWLSWDTLMRVLVDIGRSVASSPVRRLVFVNGHGGNSALLQVACRELRRQFGLWTFLMHPAVPVDQGGGLAGADELGMGVHAGRVETSWMLHLRPDLVHLERAQRSVPEHLARYEHVGFGKPVSFGWLSDDFGSGGVIGDPTGATAAEGAAIFSASVDAGVAAMHEIALFDPRG